MLRRILLLTLLYTSCWVASLSAAQITVTYGFGSTNSVDASLNGVALGPAINLNVSDQQTGQVFDLSGLSASSTGRSTSFLVLSNPNVVLANFAAGGPNSVVVTDGLGNILISGMMESRGSLVSTYPQGTGGFQGDFLVQFVAPSLLAKFNLPPVFLPDGSVSATYGDANLTGLDHLTGAVGGGSVTIQTPAPVAEIGTMFLFGSGLFISMVGIRKFNQSN